MATKETSSEARGLPSGAEWRAGSVTFTDWIRVPWTDRLLMGVVGEVFVTSTQDALGFDMSGGGHANWLAVVRGPSGALHVVPGCKIQCVTYGAQHVNSDFLAVP